MHEPVFACAPSASTAPHEAEPHASDLLAGTSVESRPYQLRILSKSLRMFRECTQLYKSLIKVKDRKDLTSDTLMRDFYRMTGNLNELYGLANLDALSNKRQRVLPARCRVYDLLNFASEIATHHSTAEGARSMQACIGTLISDEYDLEGTAETATEFADFFVQSENQAQRALVN